MPSMFRLAASGLAAVSLTASAATLPAGWSAAPTSDGSRAYRSEQGAHAAQLRILPAQASGEGLKDWFEARRSQPMPGVAQARFKASSFPRADMALATGQGVDAQGQAVLLVRLACRRPQGGFVFGESSMSNDEAWFRSTIQQVGEIFSQACTEGATEGDVARLAPAPAAKPAPRAEPPFPYVKPAGTGLKTGEVETILREWRNEQAGMTMQVRTYHYLLLKDGSYRDGLPPVALEDFDAAASQRGEPKRWGRWTRSGGRYALVGAGRPQRPDNALVRLPAQRDEKLDGTWEIHTAYSTMWSVSQSHRTVRFERDGRFLRNSGGSIVGGAGSTAAGNAVGGSVVRNDDSSSSTVGGPNFGGGSSRQRPSTEPDRSGSYRLDGYTLELRYDSGRVERLAFCASADRDALWFDGEELSRRKPAAR